MYSALSFDIQQSLLGKCTKYKERLCYHTRALDSPAAVLLSKLVGYLVDRSKQGITFTPEDWDRLRAEHIKAPYLEDPDYWHDRQPTRAPGQGQRHILDFLKFDVAEKSSRAP